MDYSLLVGVYRQPTAAAAAAHFAADSHFVNGPLGRLVSVDGTEIYRVGVIDFAAVYGAAKAAAHAFRGAAQPASLLSSVPAGEYGRRFLRFILSVFV
jgi:hypothetical protein